MLQKEGGKELQTQDFFNLFFGPPIFKYSWKTLLHYFQICHTMQDKHLFCELKKKQQIQEYFSIQKDQKDRFTNPFQNSQQIKATCSTI